MPNRRISLNKKIKIIQMAMENYSIRKIAKDVNVDTRTVKKYKTPLAVAVTLMEKYAVSSKVIKEVNDTVKKLEEND